VRSPSDPTAVVGRRCLQAMLDRALETAGGLVVAILLVLVLHQLHVEPRTNLRAAAAGWLATIFALGLANEILLPRYASGATVGMQVFRLRIVTMTGDTPSWKALILRWLLWQIDGLFFALAGIVVMLCTPRHQRLGDLVAGTLVIRRSLDEGVLPGPDRDLGAVPEPELALGAGQMRLDRGQREP